MRERHTSDIGPRSTCVERQAHAEMSSQKSQTLPNVAQRMTWWPSEALRANPLRRDKGLAQENPEQP